MSKFKVGDRVRQILENSITGTVVYVYGKGEKSRLNVPFDMRVKRDDGFRARYNVHDNWGARFENWEHIVDTKTTEAGMSSNSKREGEGKASFQVGDRVYVDYVTEKAYGTVTDVDEWWVYLKRDDGKHDFGNGSAWLSRKVNVYHDRNIQPGDWCRYERVKELDLDYELPWVFQVAKVQQALLDVTPETAKYDQSRPYTVNCIKIEPPVQAKGGSNVDNKATKVETGLEAWEQEFYPVPAKSDTLTDDVKRIDHAIQKWKGFREGELARLEVTGDELRNRGFMTDRTCALCVTHKTRSDCGRCPFVTVRGKKCYQDGEPYELYMEQDKGPEPMIIALQELRRAVEQKQTSARVAEKRAKLAALKREMEELAAEVGECDPWKVGGTD